MALDADIAAATAADLEKIKVQDWRNDVFARRTSDQAHWLETASREERRLKALEDQTKFQLTAVNGFAIEDINALIVALAPNYMKPSTATTVDGMTSDTEKDGEFLRLAIRKVLAVRNEFIGA